MAHELDITDGQVSFANSRSDAWHRLGQSVGHAMTAREALQAAHLAGWNVRKMPLQVPQEPVIDDTGVTTPAPLAVPDFYATVRTNPINGRLDVLGCRRQQVRARPKRGLLRPARRSRGSKRRRAFRDRRRPARWTRNVRHHEAAQQHGLRRQRWQPRTAPISTSRP